MWITAWGGGLINFTSNARKSSQTASIIKKIQRKINGTQETYNPKLSIELLKQANIDRELRITLIST